MGDCHFVPGVTLDGGKRYSQTVDKPFHLSMAALESNPHGMSLLSPLEQVCVQWNSLRPKITLWQSQWDEFLENKLYKIFPMLKECTVCPRTNRKEETVMAQLHIGHSFVMVWSGQRTGHRQRSQ